MRGLALPLALLAISLPTAAHQASDAYLFVDQQADRSTLRWDIALRDLDVVLDLDTDGDRALTWGEVRAAWPRIDALALASLRVAGCDFRIDGHALEQRSDGAYAVLQLSAPCAIAAQAPLHYGLFATVDPTHRGILRHTRAGASPTVRLLTPERLPTLAAVPDRRADASAPPPAAPGPAGSSAAVASTVAEAPRTIHAPAATANPMPPPPVLPAFVGDGVHHILTGYDHLLFLLCLLLPAVLRREQGAWLPVAGWRQALLPVLRTVTLFTLAHSVTLVLAALGWVRLAPAIVEPAIALTIALAAVDNLRPGLQRWRGTFTFGFGLVHGFGFAGVLGELSLPPAQFGWALLQFNLGLELGQIMLVAAVVPLLFVLRRRALYVPGVMGAGSALALAMAAVWLVERSSDWRLLPT